MKLQPELETVRRLVPGLARMLGEDSEVVLHDLSHLNASIVAIEGNVTGRRVGGGGTNYLVSMVQKYGDEAPDCINYKNMLPDNRVLRSTTLYIHDEEGKVVGALCVNRDVTRLLAARQELERLTSFDEEDLSPRETASEVFATSIPQVMEAMVNTEVALCPHAVAFMQKDEKMALVNKLAQRGVFEVRGAVEYVATRLGVTNYTIYNYLKAIKDGKDKE